MADLQAHLPENPEAEPVFFGLRKRNPEFSGGANESFRAFAFDMRQELTAARVWQEVIRTAADAGNDANTRVRRAKAAGMIIRCLSGDAHALAAQLDEQNGFNSDPYVLWQGLEEEFKEQDARQRIQARRSLLNLRWSDGKGTARGLQRYIRSQQNRLEGDAEGAVPSKVIRDRLFTIIPVAYRPLVQHLIMKDETTLDEVFTNLKKWETFYPEGDGPHMEKETQGNRALFQRQWKERKPMFNQQEQSQCENCNSPSHTAKSCDRPKARCHYCGKHGHLQHFCRSKKRDERQGGHKRDQGSKGDHREKNNRASRPLPRASQRTQPKREVPECAFVVTPKPNRGLRVLDGSAQDALLRKNIAAFTEGQQIANLICDSGATCALTSHRAWLKDYKPCEDVVQGADGNNIRVTGTGTLRFLTHDTEGQECIIVLRDVQHAPALRKDVNLLSVGRLTKAGGALVLRQHGSYLELPNTSRVPITMQGCLPTIEGHPETVPSPKQGVYLCIDDEESTVNRAYVTDKVEPTPIQKMWHSQLGHPPYRNMREHARNTTGIPPEAIPTTTTDPWCTPCVEYKTPSAPRTRQADREINEGRRTLHADVLGPFPQSHLGKNTHMLVVVDEDTRFVRTLAMKGKKATTETLDELLTDLKTDSQIKMDFEGGPHVLQADHDVLFLSTATKEVLRKHHFVLQVSEPYAHWRNGIVEKAIQRLRQTASCLQTEAGVPPSFWPSTYRHASDMINKSPHRSLEDHRTPHEVLTGHKPDLTHARPFGALVYVMDHSRQKKADPRMIQAIYLGEDYVSQGRRVYVPETSSTRVVARANCRFAPYGTWPDPSCFTDHPHPPAPPSSHPTTMDHNNHTQTGTPGTEGHISDSDGAEGHNHQDDATDGTAHDFGGAVADDFGGAAAEDNDTVHVSGGAQQNIHHEETDTAEAIATDTPVQPTYRITNIVDHRGEDGETEVKIKWHGYNERYNSWEPLANIREDLSDEAYSNLLHDYTERTGTQLALMIQSDCPRTMTQALRRSDAQRWIQAADLEVAKLQQRDVFEPVQQLPHGHTAIPMVAVLTHKLNPDGSIARYKFRLCAAGNREGPVDNIISTTAPVMLQDTFKLVIAITAAHPKWELLQLDYSAAYTNCDLPPEREVYVRFPPGVYGSTPQEPTYARLRKCLYGLRDSGAHWWRLLDKTLKEVGLERSRDDLCLYTLKENGELLVCVSVWVDDLLIAGQTDHVESIVQQLRKRHEVTVQEAHKFVGIEIGRKQDGVITLSQGNYIDDLVDKHQMGGAKTKHTPMAPGVRLYKADQPAYPTRNDIERATYYRGLVGGLLYLGWTRPDLLHVTATLARHCQAPTHEHILAAHNALKYVKTTRNLLSIYGKDLRDNRMYAYCDADFAGDTTCRSTTGYTIFMNGSILDAKSKLQSIVSLSSTEAETIALSECTRSIVALRNRLVALGHPQLEPTPVFVDNQTTITLVGRDVNGPRSKHFGVRLAYIKDCIDRKLVEVHWVPTDRNASDLLTKPLARTKTATFRAQVLGQRPTHCHDIDDIDLDNE